MDMTLYKRCLEARDQLTKDIKDWGVMTRIAIVREKNIYLSTTTICHAGLRLGGYGREEKGGLAVVSALMKPGGDELYEDEALLYLDWLLNRSPYSEVFITKSPHEALATKMIIADGSKPSNLMAAGLVASRRLWEYSYIARVFCDLAKAGVNEDLAYYLGHISSTSFDTKGNFNWGTYKSGHCSLNPGVFGPKELKNFIDHKPISLNKPYSESSDYDGYDGMYGTNRGDHIGGWIHKNFPYGDNDKKGVNPFAAAGKVKTCSYEHAIKTMAEWQHVLFKHIEENIK